MRTTEGRIHRLLTWRGLPVLAAVAAFILTLPALRLGWNLDDYAHQVWLRGRDAFPDWNPALFPKYGAVDLFGFIRGEPDQYQALLDRGVLPWWTLRELRLSFFRPITAFTHILDYGLWPKSPEAMHLHSLLWFGGAVLLVALLYRRVMGTTIAAGLAILMFALDDAHAQPAAWIANRNALVALFFGVAAILAHHRATTQSAWAWRILAVLCFASALLSAEAGVGAGAYLGAHALFLETGRWRKRIGGIVPYVVVLAVWRVVYVRLGYGAYGSGFYFDLSNEPLWSAVAFLRHAPVELLAQWGVPPAEFYIAGLQWGFWLALVLAGVGFVVLLAVILVPLLRRDRQARFWAAGMVFALVPACSAMPMDRLLLFIGIGGHALAGMFVAGIFQKAEWRATNRIWRVAAACMAVFFVAVHLVIAPLVLPVRTRNIFRMLGGDIKQVAAALPAEATEPEAHVILINPHTTMDALYIPLVRTLAGDSAPYGLWVLGPGGDELVVSRPDAKTLVLTPRNGFLRQMLDQLYRGPQHPFAVGDKVDLPGIRVYVLAVNDERLPAEVAFHFEHGLDAPHLVLLAWQREGKGGRYVSWSPPKVGGKVTLAASALY